GVIVDSFDPGSNLSTQGQPGIRQLTRDIDRVQVPGVRRDQPLRVLAINKVREAAIAFELFAERRGRHNPVLLAEPRHRQNRRRGINVHVGRARNPSLLTIAGTRYLYRKARLYDSDRPLTRVILNYDRTGIGLRSSS